MTNKCVHILEVAQSYKAAPGPALAQDCVGAELMNWLQSDGFFHPRLCRLWSGSGQNMVTVSRGVQVGFDRDVEDIPSGTGITFV